MSGELIAILAVGVATWGAFMPMLLSINSRLQALGERMARIEGELSMWRQGPPQPERGEER